jgi:hypothetical protein
MAVSLETRAEARSKTAGAATTHAWISMLRSRSRARAWTALLSLCFAACEGAEQQEPEWRMPPPSNVTMPGGVGASAGGGVALPPGTGGGTLSGGAWPMTFDAGVAPVQDAAAPRDAATGQLCNRDFLGHTIDRLFLALKAHDISSLPFAANAKFTENGRQLKLGEGIWKTAGATAFKHTAYDIEACTTVTEAVITEGSADVPIGVRVRFEPPAPGTAPSGSQEILEVEVIVVRAGAYPMPSDTAAIAASAGEMWEALVPASQRLTRAQLEQIVSDYFVYFPAGACHFAPQCLRYENGFSPGGCALGLSCAAPGTPGRNARPRLTVVDPEAGIAVGFGMSANAYTAFYMFRVRGGQVQGQHAILASAAGSGW